MRYVTHQFAHPETLDRARRWLVQLGFEPARLEVSHSGPPRLAVAVGPGEAAEVEMVINAAEESDPDGTLSLWDVARHHHIYIQSQEETGEPQRFTRPASFVIGWRPIDEGREVIEATAGLNVVEAYVDHWE